MKDNRHKRRLESRKQRAGLRVKEEFLYVCGSTLFPGGDMQDKILVKESLHCGSPIETTYYSGIYSDFSQNYNVLFNKKGNKAQLFIWYSIIISGKSPIFDNICFNGGDTEITRNRKIWQPGEEYGIVRPIWQTCYSAGKKPATRCAKKLKKRRGTWQLYKMLWNITKSCINKKWMCILVLGFSSSNLTFLGKNP